MTQVSDGARQAGGASFQVGLALSRTFGVYKRGFVKFTLLAWTYLAPLLLVQIAADFLLAPHQLNLVYQLAPWVLLPAWIIGHGACVIGAAKLLDGESFETERTFWVVAGVCGLSSDWDSASPRRARSTCCISARASSYFSCSPWAAPPAP